MTGAARCQMMRAAAGWALVPERLAHHDATTTMRFDPLYWTVNFPRPMMAAVVTHGVDALRVSASFTDRGQLAGLIWQSRDRASHPLLALDEARDYRRCVLRFRWRSGGIKRLDAVHGPTLTIEGRDAAGRARAWYVRLWNHAVGTPEDAVVTLDFGRLAGGFLLPAEADPVWAGDIDRMMVTLVPPGYDGTAEPLAAPAEAWAELSDIACTGSGAIIGVGDAMIPPHALGIATGYDDCYDQTPARVVRQVARLGYRGDIVHYVGMSHFPRLGMTPDGRAMVDEGAADPLCGPARAWHEAFAAEAAAAGLGVIWSLSFELLASLCPEPWQQRFADGVAARTGWDPPSALLGPGHDGAVGWLARAMAAFVALAAPAGLAPSVQVGEPWWWVRADGAIAIEDAASRTAIAQRLGHAPTPVDLTATDDFARGTLRAAGAVLAAATARIVSAAREAAGDVVTHLLVFTPTALDPAWPDVALANVPDGWAAPAFDVLQVEDYDWLTGGRADESGPAADAMAARLGHAVADQHYLAGFVAGPEQRDQWAQVMEGARAGAARGHARVIVWALPQVVRDGLVVGAAGNASDAGDAGDEGDGTMRAFDAVRFPLEIGRGAEVATEFSTQIIAHPSGHEQRVTEWADARMRYDAGPGVRSAKDVALLTAFFRARRGAARGFLFHDPTDGTSAADGVTAPEGTDQMLGTGDGVRTLFALVKRYGAVDDMVDDGVDGAQARPIGWPVADSIVVTVDGAVVPAVLVPSADAGLPGGAAGVRLDRPPPPGARVRAGYRFDVPVRFATDVLRVGPALTAAGEVPSVELVEVRS